MKRAVVWTLAALSPVVFLVSCGGGSGSAASTDAQKTAIDTGSASGYLSVLMGSGDSNKVSGETTVYAYDDQTLTPVVTAQATGPDESSRAIVSEAWSATDFKLEGSASLVYLDHGLIKRISLKKSDSHVPVQVSNIADACSLRDYSGGGADGLNILLHVGRSGKNGDCSGGVTSTAYVRSNAAASEAPLAFPAGTDVITAFDDVNGNALGYLAVTGGLVKIFSPDLTVSNVVAGSSGVTSLSDQAGLLNQNTEFATSGKSIYRITLGDNFTGVMTAVHTAATSSASSPNFEISSDASNLYYCDGGTVYSVGKTGSESAMGTVPGACNNVRPGPSGLLVSTDNTADSLWFLPYAGAKAVSLGVHAGQVVILGGTTSNAYYAVASTGLGVLKSVGLDGSGETVISARNGVSGYGHAIPVFKNWLQARPTLSGLIYFDLPSGVTADGQSDLYQIDVATNNKVKLGTFNLSQSFVSAYDYLFDGKLWAFTAYGRNSGSSQTTTDLWFVKQGQTDSLRRASSFLK